MNILSTLMAFFIPTALITGFVAIQAYYVKKELKRIKGKYPQAGKVVKYDKEIERLLEPELFDEHELRIS